MELLAILQVLVTDWALPLLPLGQLPLATGRTVNTTRNIALISLFFRIGSIRVSCVKLTHSNLLPPCPLRSPQPVYSSSVVLDVLTGHTDGYKAERRIEPFGRLGGVCSDQNGRSTLVAYMGDRLGDNSRGNPAPAKSRQREQVLHHP
jgi:hypothetical protein